jgi:hypothetical protein
MVVDCQVGKAFIATREDSVKDERWLKPSIAEVARDVVNPIPCRNTSRGDTDDRLTDCLTQPSDGGW